MLDVTSAVAATQLPEPQASYRSGTLVALVQLHWFIRLRWMFVAVALGVLAAERFVLPDTARPASLFLVILSVAAINAVWMLTARLLRRQSQTGPDDQRAAIRSAELFANGQVAVDLLLLTGILHYTGGVENPMFVFYVFHVAIGGLLLERWQALAQSIWAVVLYASLAAGEWHGWLAHFALLPGRVSGALHQRPEYVLLMVAVDGCVVLGTLYFTLRITRLLDRHEAELREANRALAKSRQAIQDLQHRRARFMQMAAHQLKSPLAIVHTLASLISDRVVVDEPTIVATCQKIARRAQEGITQVTELLTFARVQDADPARKRGLADVLEIVRELCRRFEPVAQQKQIDLSLWMPPHDSLLVNVDPQDLRDCVGNLIDNALKYTPGPGQVRVAVTAKLEGAQPTAVSIHVSDTGVGLDPGMFKSAGRVLGEEPIFDAFRRGANVIAAGIPGTGLGLSIVREVVEQAGGRIWVMSRPGAGTSFTIMFPAASASEAAPLRDTRATQVVLELPPEAPQGGAETRS
jgi:signal transduction histidine kinase